MSSIATTENISPILAGDDILKPTTQEGTAQEEGTDNKKKSNLPAKFFKSMVFGYWNLMRLKQDSIITEEVYSKALQDYLKPFASVTDQTALYESFENDFKMLSKDLKKMIKDHHKPPKVKKAKVVKEKKVKGDAKLRTITTSFLVLLKPHSLLPNPLKLLSNLRGSITGRRPFLTPRLTNLKQRHTILVLAARVVLIMTLLTATPTLTITTPIVVVRLTKNLLRTDCLRKRLPSRNRNWNWNRKRN